MAKHWERKLKRELKNEVLKEFEGWDTNELVAYIIDLREQIKRLEAHNSGAGSNSRQKPEKHGIKESMFRQEWSYPSKIHFLLLLHQRPLTSEDLDRDLLRLDSHYKDYNNPKKNLSVHLGRASKSGRIKKIKEPGIKLKYYALLEWMDKEDVLKEEFKGTMQRF